MHSPAQSPQSQCRRAARIPSRQSRLAARWCTLQQGARGSSRRAARPEKGLPQKQQRGYLPPIPAGHRLCTAQREPSRLTGRWPEADRPGSAYVHAQACAPARRRVFVAGLRQLHMSMLRRGWKSMLEMYLQAVRPGSTSRHYSGGEAGCSMHASGSHRCGSHRRRRWSAGRRRCTALTALPAPASAAAAHPGSTRAGTCPFPLQQPGACNVFV